MQNPSAPGSVKAICSYARPYDPWDEPYQAYFRHGLQVCMEAHGGPRPKIIGLTTVAPLIRLLRRVRYCSPILRWTARKPAIGRVIDALAHSLAPSVVGPANIFVPIVGQYLITYGDGTMRRICIDAQDSPVLASQALVEWADVYFKSNMWLDHEYPSNVLPVVNGNPLVSRDETLLRHAGPKTGV